MARKGGAGAEARGRSGPGGDPYARALGASPYTVLPDVGPDDPIRNVLLTQARLQRRRLTVEEDAAFRTLRDLSARLAWDLATLGTTPLIEEALWERTRSLLAEDRRNQAVQLWLRDRSDRQSDPAGLHVRAVLSANALAWHASRGDVPEALIRVFVGRWVALLAQEDWLWTFVKHRCDIWSKAGGAPLDPDITDTIRFQERAGKTALDLLRGATASDDRRQRSWLATWETERAAVDVLGRACAGGKLPGGFVRGVGPLGLEEAGHVEKARRSINRAIATGADAFPLLRLRSGKASFARGDATGAATAAAGIRYLFSSVSGIAADVWAGNGRRAVERLREWRASAPDAWFGDGEEGRRALAAARCELLAEALLVRFREELSREDVPVADARETAAEILSLAAALPQTAQVLEAVEGQLSGRVRVFLEGGTLPHAGEIARVLSLAREVRALLLPAGAGQRSSHDVARLLLRRAISAWNGVEGLPGAARRDRILRDLFEAAELAPHNTDILEGLASVVRQIQPTLESRAEGRALLQRVKDQIDRCLEHGGAVADLAQSRQRILEALDPAAALRDSWKAIDDILAVQDADDPRT